MRSLRGRLIVGTLIGITLFLAAGGVAIYVLVRQRLVAELDRSIEAVVRSSAPGITRELARDRYQGERRPPSPFPEPSRRDDLIYQCWNPRGETVSKSERLGEASLPRMAESLDEVEFEELATDTMSCAFIELPDGTPARAIAARFQPPEGPRGERAPPGRRPGRDPEGERPDRPRRPELAPGERPSFELVMAREATGLVGTLASLRWLLAISWLASSLGSAGVLAWLVDRGLRPLDRLRGEIEALDEDRLTHRFDLPDVPAEMAPLVEHLNGLVARIQRAFEREKAFTADAAHELRTPLAGLRATLEVVLNRPRSSDELREAAEQSLDIAEQMQATVECLLALARLDARPAGAEPSPVPLAELVDTCLEPLADTIAARELSVAVRVDAAFQPQSDPAMLRRVVENLLSNVTEYADAGSEIEVVARDNGKERTLEVSNLASRAPTDLAERAFEAFWRADASRTQRAHAGLGLSICKRIAEALAIELSATYENGRFTITLGW